MEYIVWLLVGQCFKIWVSGSDNIRHLNQTSKLRTTLIPQASVYSKASCELSWILVSKEIILVV